MISSDMLRQVAKRTDDAAIARAFFDLANLMDKADDDEVRHHEETLESISDHYGSGE